MELDRTVPKGSIEVPLPNKVDRLEEENLRLKEELENQKLTNDMNSQAITELTIMMFGGMGK